MSEAGASGDRHQQDTGQSADENRYKLKDAVNINALTDAMGTELEIDPIETFDNALEHDQDFTDEYVMCKDYFSMGKGEDGKELRGCPGQEAFKNFEDKMMNLTGDGKVKKRILREGHGTTVPSESTVKVHYNAFYEHSEDPFDSSFTQGKPQKFSLHECVEGLGIAISSMQKGERAQFLVHPQLAYGSLGVPPRIPANAEILYEIELLGFTAGKVDGPKKKKTFSQVMAAARKRCSEAKICFNAQDFHGAHFQYTKAQRMLEKLQLANQEEEDEWNVLSKKVYKNLAACLVKEKKPRLACSMCKEALRLQPNDAKALFLFGRALLLLQDYDAAREKLTKALNLKKGDVDILEELDKVNQKQAEFRRNETLFARKMFPGL